MFTVSPVVFLFYAARRKFTLDRPKSADSYPSAAQVRMPVRVAACGTTAVAGSYAELCGMVSMAMQALPDLLLFPFPILKEDPLRVPFNSVYPCLTCLVSPLTSPHRVLPFFGP